MTVRNTITDKMLNLPASLKQTAEQLAAERGMSLNQFVVSAVAEKVSTLQQSSSDPGFPGIAYRYGASGQPTAILQSTGIRVQTIAIAAHHWGQSPQQIATDYALSLAQVTEALGFYAAHQAELDAAIASEQSLEAANV